MALSYTCSLAELDVEVICEPYSLRVQDEPLFIAGSSDNANLYKQIFEIAGNSRPSSRHGLFCREPDETLHSCILIAGGGSSAIHENSATVVNGFCFVAVGDQICSLSLPTLDLIWATKVDQASCFGVYYSPVHDCLLSHGELEVARLNLRGEVVWSAGGADIFSEGFRIVGDHVEAIDFFGQVYYIDIATGQVEMVDH
jgi:hypothetical protein